MPNESHQLPILCIITSPSGHAGKANTMLDNEKDFPIRQVLSARLAEIGSGWKKALIDHRLAIAIGVVTDGTVVREVIARFRHIQW